MTWRRWWLTGFACAGLLSACRTESAPEGGGSPAPAASAAKETLVFGRAQPRRAVEIRLHMSMDVKAEVREGRDAPPRTSSVASGVENVTRYRVLEASGDGLKAELTFVRDRERDGPTTETGPLEGHTFVIDTRSGERTVTEQGRPARGEDRERVIEMIDGSLGEMSDLEHVLGGRTVELGQRLPELEGVLARMFQLGSGEEQVSGVRAHLRSRDPDGTAVIAEVKWGFSLVEEPLRVTAPLQGTVSLDLASGALRKLAVRGPARVEPLPEAAAGGMSASGEGTILLEVEIATLAPGSATAR
jgi:hypothetical protein